MGDLNLVLVGPLGLWSGSLLYGINLVFFFACLRLLLKPRYAGERKPWVLISGITIQFILSTIHMILVLGAGATAFLVVPPTATAKALVSKWLSIFNIYTAVQQIIYGLNNMFGDLVLVWRVYKVFTGQAWICILPLLLALSNGAVALYNSTFIFVNPTALAEAGTRATLERGVTANFVMMALTQLLLTGLLGAKIWWVSRNLGSRYMGVIWMLVESGALLAAVDIIYLVIWRIDWGHASQFMLCMLGQLTAIVPLTIILRVGLGLAVTAHNPRGTSTAGSTSSMPKLGTAIWKRPNATGTTVTFGSSTAKGTDFHDEMEMKDV